MSSKELIDYLLENTKNIQFAILDDRDSEKDIKVHCVGYNSEVSVSFEKRYLNDKIYLIYEISNIVNSLGRKTYLEENKND